MTDDELNVPGHDGVNDSLRVRLVPVLFLTAIFTINFTARILLSPLSPSIEHDLHMGHADIGGCFFMITLGYFISLIGSGFVSSRITHKKTVTLSAIAVGGVTIAVSKIDSPVALNAGMFLLGLMTGIYLPSGIATVTGVVRWQEWGKALAIHEFAPNLAYVAAPLVVEAVLIFSSWRTVMEVIGIASVVAGITFYYFGRSDDMYGARPDFKSVRSLFSDSTFVIMVILFSLGISSTLGVYAMLPSFLVSDHGMARADANSIVAFSRISTLIMVFVAGWASDRFGAVRTLECVLITTGLVTAGIGIASSSWIVAVIFLQPLTAVAFFPAAFALLSATVPPVRRNIAVSFAISIAFMFGGGLIPVLIGALGDIGLFHVGFMLTGAGILSGGFLLARTRMNGMDIGIIKM